MDGKSGRVEGREGAIKFRGLLGREEERCVAMLPVVCRRRTDTWCGDVKVERAVWRTVTWVIVSLFSSLYLPFLTQK